MKKSITEHELLKRLDNEFDDVEFDFSYTNGLPEFPPRYTNNERGIFIVYFKERQEDEE